MPRDYSVRPGPTRGLAGQIAASDAPVLITDPRRSPRRDSVAQHIARSVTAPAGAPSSIHTTEGHPIHLDTDASAASHHAMSPTGHHESAEVLRQAAKLLFHLCDLKHRRGDTEGAEHFEREAHQALRRMENHHDIAQHKQTMHDHAATARTHATEAADLSRQITGSDTIGLADHEQAKAHPLYPRYAAARAYEQRASDGVRRAAHAAMGRSGSGVHPIELNQFLAQHGHDAHGIAESAGSDAPASGKSSLDKTLTGPASVRPIRQTRMSEIAARGGRARNQADAQRRGVGRSPAQPAQAQARAAHLKG